MAATARILLHSSIMKVSEYACDTPKSGPGRERSDTLSSLTIIRRGVHAYHARGHVTLAAPGMALLYRGGEPYCLSHPYHRSAPDRSTCLEFGPALLEEVFGPRPLAGDLGAPLGYGTQLLNLRVISTLAASPAQPLAAEEATMELIRAVAGEFGVIRDDLQRAGRARKRVERARAFIAASPAEDHSLQAVADAAACSPFHLARLFKRQTGMTIRQYRLQVRLGMALDQLADGENDLSSLAVRVGFSDHSHMTGSFKKAFGHTPSRLRGQLRSGGLRQVSKFLQATRPATA